MRGENGATVSMEEFSRPFGTAAYRLVTPTLKRWAIFGCPFGTEEFVLHS
jgi:hypothetical protein